MPNLQTSVSNETQQNNILVKQGQEKQKRAGKRSKGNDSFLFLIASTRKIAWDESEDNKLFISFKKYGARWAMIAREFNDRSENQVKNRFYSTLRRIATKKNIESHNELHKKGKLTKNYLLQYVEDAIEYGHSCSSKRGRKKKRRTPCLNSEPKPEIKEAISPSISKQVPSTTNINIYGFPFNPNPRQANSLGQNNEIEQQLALHQMALSQMQRKLMQLDVMQHRLINCLTNSGYYMAAPIYTGPLLGTKKNESS